MCKALSLLACVVCQASCLAMSVTVAEVCLDHLLKSSRKIDKYYEVLGQVDYALEDAIIGVSNVNRDINLDDRDYMQHGKDVLRIHDEHAGGADELYKKDKFASIKSKAHGLSHAFGKHMQMLNANTQSDVGKIRQNALNLYEYMLNDEVLLDTYKALRTRSDTLDKKNIVDMVMKYLVIARVIQMADSFAVGEYEKNGASYSGVAFFTQSLLYNSGSRPEMLFVPIKHASAGRPAYIASIYPLNSIARFCYKLNPGVFVDVKKYDSFKIEDVPESFKALITWEQNIVQPAEEPVVQKATKQIEQANPPYKTIYEKTSSLFKIRLGRNVYDVLPAYCRAKNRVSCAQRVVKWCRGVSQSYQIMIENCAEIVASDKANLFCYVFEKFREMPKLEDEYDEAYDEAFVERLCVTRAVKHSTLSPSAFEESVQECNKILCSTNIKEEVAKTSFKTEDRLLKYMRSCRDGYSERFIRGLFGAIVRQDLVELFIECFYEKLDDKFFEIFPDMLDVVYRDASQSIRMIVNSRSKKARKHYRDEVLKERDRRRTENDKLKMLYLSKNENDSEALDTVQTYLTVCRHFLVEELVAFSKHLGRISIRFIPYDKIQESFFRPVFEKVSDRLKFAWGRHKYVLPKVRESVDKLKNKYGGIVEEYCKYFDVDVEKRVEANVNNVLSVLQSSRELNPERLLDASTIMIDSAKMYVKKPMKK